jgi:lipopolysaccharide biosynthesis regulator YciM
MKEFIKAIVVVAGIAVVVLAVSWVGTPESVKVMGQIEEERARGGPAWASDMQRLRYDLAKALIDEKKAGEAVPVLTLIILQGRNPQNIYGDERPMIAADWYFLGNYYEELARAYEQLGDKTGQARALGKAAQARARETTVRAAEEAREAAREKRRREEVLR